MTHIYQARDFCTIGIEVLDHYRVLGNIVTGLTGRYAPMFYTIRATPKTGCFLGSVYLGHHIRNLLSSFLKM